MLSNYNINTICLFICVNLHESPGCRQTQQVSTPENCPRIEWGEPVVQCRCSLLWILTAPTRPSPHPALPTCRLRHPTNPRGAPPVLNAHPALPALTYASPVPTPRDPPPIPTDPEEAPTTTAPEENRTAKDPHLDSSPLFSFPKRTASVRKLPARPKDPGEVPTTTGHLLRELRRRSPKQKFYPGRHRVRRIDLGEDPKTRDPHPDRCHVRTEFNRRLLQELKELRYLPGRKAEEFLLKEKLLRQRKSTNRPMRS